MKYGKLTLIKKVKKTYGVKDRINHIFGVFNCECGNQIEKHYKSVLNGKITSCGCDKVHKKRPTLNKFYGTRVYGIWNKMKDRCTNPKNDYYHRYGGRGISVHKEWVDSSINFCEWAIANGYSDNLTIERNNVDGNYEPSNCKWIPKGDQSKNTCRTVLVTLHNKTMCLKDWCKEYGVIYESVRHRIRAGWDVIEAITTPTKVYKLKIS